MRGAPTGTIAGARSTRPAAPEPRSEEATVLMRGPGARPGTAGTVAPPPVPPPAPPADEPPVTAREQSPVVPGSRRSVLPLVLGIVGLVLFLGVLTTAAILIFKRRPVAPSPSPVVAASIDTKPVASPSTVPAVTSGTLHVESTPPGATVSVDGEKIGKTPLDAPDLALGSHEVKLELDSYAPATVSVMLTAQAPLTEVRQTLSRTVPATGFADLTSNPDAAMVKIDGTSVGMTPLRGHKLNVGRHRVEFSAEGYDPFTGSVTVREGQTARLEATLQARPTPPPARPSPTPHVFPDDHVYDENDGAIQPKPIKVSGKSAEYPKDAPALKRGQRASVTVSFVVLDSGEVTDVQIVESAGTNVDDAVISAYKTWKFTPGMKQGAKVRVRVTRRQTFLGG
jgi:TonB family protein